MNPALPGGVACALAAGLLWGLVFIVPLLLPGYPAAQLSAGRYLAFGLVALPLALADRSALARLTRADWREALRLALVGNLAYYALLAAAIQQAGAPLPTMIIGTLPVVIAVCANLGRREIAWRRLALPLAVLAAGIALVHASELSRLRTQGQSARELLVGALLAAGAVACWTWYPIRNARWLQANPQVGSGTWATAQGLATLPLAAALWVVLWLPARPDLLGPEPLRFLALMLLTAVGASWLGTVLWNRASQQLPTALAGQLIVFETLAALAYAFALRGEAPGPLTLSGVALLVAGVVLGVRAFHDAARAGTVAGHAPAGRPSHPGPDQNG
ncbi:MAG: DMT family transporter [Burkholderiales bacterium]